MTWALDKPPQTHSRLKGYGADYPTSEIANTTIDPTDRVTRLAVAMTRRPLISTAAALSLTLCVGVSPAIGNNYTPSGTIVAESGFRPDTNGYSFPNYGNEDNPQNLDVAGMQKLFGGAVCVGGAGGGDCTLTPAARAWKEAQNKGMGGGHCEGFAISSSLFYAGLGEPPTPSPFGADTVPALSLAGNTGLQAQIAYTFVFQSLHSVSTTKVNGSPTEVLAALSAALPSKEPLVLGVYKRGFKGGHAITPLAIEDRGEGKFAVLVYDNNFPNTIREVDIDQSTDTWNYTASTNPSESASAYEGDASSKTLEVEYAKNGLGVQPCPFCAGGSSKVAPKGLAAEAQKAQLLWEGDPRDGQHSEVTIVDGDGNVAGSTGSGEDSELTSEIPGVEVAPVKLGGDTGVDVETSQRRRCSRFRRTSASSSTSTATTSKPPPTRASRWCAMGSRSPLTI